MSGNLPHCGLHRTTRPSGNLDVSVQAVAHATEATRPAATRCRLAASYGGALSGVTEQAHDILIVALGTLDAVLVFGLFGKQLLALHLGLHLGWHVGYDELHDAS